MAGRRDHPGGGRTQWDFAVGDFSGSVLSLEEFQRRLAERPARFFWPEGWYDSSPRGRRKARAESLVLLFPVVVESESIRRLMRSLGAAIHPDEVTDAQLCRESACVWVYVRSPGEIPVRPDVIGTFENALGGRIRSAVELDVADARGAEAVALEVIEAFAARWDFVIEGFEGQVMTLDGLRVRAARGASDLFRAEG